MEGLAIVTPLPQIVIGSGSSEGEHGTTAQQLLCTWH